MVTATIRTGWNKNPPIYKVSGRPFRGHMLRINFAARTVRRMIVEIDTLWIWAVSATVRSWTYRNVIVSLSDSGKRSTASIIGVGCSKAMPGHPCSCKGTYRAASLCLRCSAHAHRRRMPSASSAVIGLAWSRARMASCRASSSTMVAARAVICSSVRCPLTAWLPTERQTSADRRHRSPALGHT